MGRIQRSGLVAFWMKGMHGDELSSRLQRSHRSTRIASFSAICWIGLCLLLAAPPMVLGQSAGSNPVPLINQPLVPDAVAPGGPAVQRR